MGFITGFFSGFALTTSLLYITIQVHKETRLEQRKLIREQVDQINYLAASSGAYDRRFEPLYTPRRLEDRAARRGEEIDMKEILKHRWNKEVEKLARKAQETRWEDVTDTAIEGWKAAVKFVKRE